MRLLAGILTLSALLLLTPRLRATASYVYHDRSGRDITEGATNSSCGGALAYTSPLAPVAGEVEILRFKVEFQNYTSQARVYWTRDGSVPAGALGGASGTTQVATASYVCTYTPFADVIDILEASVPAQAAGTTVRYILSAWHSGGGDEIFANSGTCPGCTPCTSASCAQVFSYVVPGVDAGLASDAGASLDGATAMDAAATIDSALIDRSLATDADRSDRSSAVDVGKGDTQPADRSSPDLGSPGDARLGDSAQEPDAAIQDLASPADHPTVTDGRVAVDTAPADAGIVDHSAMADATALDQRGGDQGSGEACEPGCLNETTRLVCGSQGQRMELACTGDTRCRDGRCQSLPANENQDEAGGCACRSQAHQASPFFALGALLWSLRRRGRQC